MVDGKRYTCNCIVNYNTSRQIIAKMIQGTDYERCGCIAKYFEDNQWYCGKHAPSKIKERETKRYEQWKEKMQNKKMHTKNNL